MKFILFYYLIVNVFALFLYGIDKRKAIKNKYRISEATLLLIAFLGGSIGALTGMYVFHHKTKHIKFLLLVPISLCIHIFIIFFFK